MGARHDARAHLVEDPAGDMGILGEVVPGDYDDLVPAGVAAHGVDARPHDLGRVLLALPPAHPDLPLEGGIGRRQRCVIVI